MVSESRRSLVDILKGCKELIFPLIIVGTFGTLSGIAAYGGTKERQDRYEVASPERFQSTTRDNRIIVNYAGRDYVLMYNNKFNRPELFPASRE